MPLTHLLTWLVVDGRALESFEAEIERFGSKDSEYLVGNRLSLADIAIVPFLERLSHTLAHYRGFELLPDDGKHTRLRRLLAAARARPAFQSTCACLPACSSHARMSLGFVE